MSVFNPIVCSSVSTSYLSAPTEDAPAAPPISQESTAGDGAARSPAGVIRREEFGPPARLPVPPLSEFYEVGDSAPPVDTYEPASDGSVPLRSTKLPVTIDQFINGPAEAPPEPTPLRSGPMPTADQF
jgi:hypothetical protein